MTNELFNAALSGDQGVLEQYKIENSDVDWNTFKDKAGNTLISTAASKGKLHIIDFLIDQGGLLSISNNQGETDLEIAYNEGHPNTARGLIVHYKSANIDLTLSKENLESLTA